VGREPDLQADFILNFILLSKSVEKMSPSQIFNLVINKQFPATLVHFLTDRCNARCPFCFIDFHAEDHGKNELSIEEIDQMTRLLPRSLTNVNFTGGEPFLRKDIFEIAASYFTHSAVQSIFITSNGYFTERTKAFCQNILEKFPGKEIFIGLSIDDLPEDHDKIRKVKGLFSKCIDTFAMLKQMHVNVRPSISITISQQNYQHAEEIYELLLNQYSVDAVQLIMVRSEGVFKFDETYRNALLNAYSKLCERLAADYKSNRLKGFDRDSLRGKVLNKKNELSRKILTEYLHSPHYMHPCQAAALFGVITATGDVYPCEVLNKPLGNLREYNYDLKEIWKGKAAADARQFISKTHCNCEYECAMSVNILSNFKYHPSFIKALVA
jgi:radical SAM protein with 4Fe4S-binding SPASM domain